MKKFTNCVLLTFVIFVALLNAINAKNDVLDTNAVNNQGNSVRIDFMDLKRVEFMEQLPLVKSTIAKYLTDYCRDDSNNCREITRTNFTGESIEFFGGSDKERYHEEGRFVVSHINAKLTSLDDSGADLGYLSKESMEDFMTKYREQIVKDTSVPIAFINKKLVYPQRGNIDNYIIVSVSCAFCLFLIIFNLICQRKINKEAKEEFLKKAAELKPLIKTPVQTNEGEILNSKQNLSVHSEGSDYKTSKPPNAISRHDSFDQKLDTRSSGGASNSGKRRKKSRSSSNSSIIAGNVGSGIGSPRNLTEPHDENRQSSNAINKSMSGDLNHDARRSKRHLNISSHSINRHAEEVQIPIYRVDSNFDRKNYQVETININEYPDPKVAYRLASNQN